MTLIDLADIMCLSVHRTRNKMLTEEKQPEKNKQL